ncbi:hypothetical protein HRR83_000432 [Exophiala dermatitidis]|uniref:Uncharacterized protein n=1 Tax=Exophiala dermatitidis TaxID=5970 RepID=A0AAN6F1D6_EXODE|nr:hypothetical protein HRR74_000434 [Exophiala dermatitidis]KAJ4528315.1 hypothetical protein HRR73_000938 [Exophiala dermatitidis]KAJ4531263.1 hypothetical protein HRR76_008931 [Exophiala dermatitidis]KAJ4558425.1 hypothetical protein HRR77_000433 [Exophiala dermatitidis]KAJ4581539.1 hypothetical protein HRR79_000563 [Exophiala dermatitidis]
MLLGEKPKTVVGMNWDYLAWDYTPRYGHSLPCSQQRMIHQPHPKKIRDSEDRLYGFPKGDIRVDLASERTLAAAIVIIPLTNGLVWLRAEESDHLPLKIAPLFSVRASWQFTHGDLSFSKDQTVLPETGRCCRSSNFAKFMWQGGRKRAQWHLALPLPAQAQTVRPPLVPGLHIGTTKRAHPS